MTWSSVVTGYYRPYREGQPDLRRSHVILTAFDWIRKKKYSYLCLVIEQSIRSATKSFHMDPALSDETQVMDDDTSAHTAPKKIRQSSASAANSAKKTRDPTRKRGPPRPHRKLDQEVLDGRITKLRSRILRCKSQLEDAERHIEGYEKEAKYRTQEKKD